MVFPLVSWMTSNSLTNRLRAWKGSQGRKVWLLIWWWRRGLSMIASARREYWKLLAYISKQDAWYGSCRSKKDNASSPPKTAP